MASAIPGEGWARTRGLGRRRRSYPAWDNRCLCCTAVLLTYSDDSDDDNDSGTADDDDDVADGTVWKSPSMVSGGEPLAGFSALVDSHCHAHVLAPPSRDSASAGGEDFLSEGCGGGGLVSAVLAVSDSDWGAVEAFARRTNDADADERRRRGWTNEAAEEGRGGAGSSLSLRSLVVPGFGVHPWYVQNAKTGWEGRLRSLLARHPGAIVGEIGLCKCAKNLRRPKEGADAGWTKAGAWALQESFMGAQLAVAGSLGRPASVHCGEQSSDRACQIIPNR